MSVSIFPPHVTHPLLTLPALQGFSGVMVSETFFMWLLHLGSELGAAVVPAPKAAPFENTCTLENSAPFPLQVNHWTLVSCFIECISKTKSFNFLLLPLINVSLLMAVAHFGHYYRSGSIPYYLTADHVCWRGFDSDSVSTLGVGRSTFTSAPGSLYIV